jgi:hypothetical protein
VPTSVGHQRDDERLRDGLAVADRQRPVAVGLVLVPVGHELVASHLVHDREHPGIDVIAPDRIGRAPRMRLDRLDHACALLGVRLVLGGDGDGSEGSQYGRKKRRAPESGVCRNGRVSLFAEPVPSGVLVDR